MVNSCLGSMLVAVLAAYSIILGVFIIAHTSSETLTWPFIPEDVIFIRTHLYFRSLFWAEIVPSLYVKTETSYFKVYLTWLIVFEGAKARVVFF